MLILFFRQNIDNPAIPLINKNKTVASPGIKENDGASLNVPANRKRMNTASNENTKRMPELSREATPGVVLWNLWEDCVRR